MLELQGVSHSITQKHGEPVELLREISLRVSRGHFMAIVGPSGCGKTTLLKVIAGILEESQGSLHWDGKDLADDAELELADLGYVPQFSVAYDHLTIEESVEAAVELRVAGVNRGSVDAITQKVLTQCGLDEISDRRVKVLSGGQRRRLGLALELVSDPRLLLCDEVTSGLDPRSESEIVHLLHGLSRVDDRIVINVTHSLAHLELYDSILVLYGGRAVYHGRPESIDHYFSVDHTEAIYPQLAARSPDEWHQSWQKHRHSYYRASGWDAKSPRANPSPLPEATSDALPAREPETPRVAAEREAETELTSSPKLPPGPWKQCAVLLRRRWTILLRDRGQLLLQLALLLGFPALIVLFTPGLFDGAEGMGIPPMPNQLTPTEMLGASHLTDAMAEAQEVAGEQFRLGVLLSGLIMFQVILLALIGSNNAAREVVSERLIYEKEKLAGLSPFSYLLSKVVFLGGMVLIQSTWMSTFVRHFTVMPGDLMPPLLLLILVNASMTTVCLAISSLARSTEQASLLSVYLVGFQLPLSNAVLALPAAVALFTQPFIAAFWGWSGQLEHLVTATAYDVGIEKALPTTLAPFETCVAVLAAHVAVGLFVAYVGVHRHRWEH